MVIKNKQKTQIALLFVLSLHTMKSDFLFIIHLHNIITDNLFFSRSLTVGDIYCLFLKLSLLKEIIYNLFLFLLVILCYGEVFSPNISSTCSTYPSSSKAGQHMALSGWSSRFGPSRIEVVRLLKHRLMTIFLKFYSQCGYIVNS